VSQDERKRMARGNTIEREADVCMTDAAPRNSNNKFVWAGI
jgi:hypothetical protein